MFLLVSLKKQCQYLKRCNETCDKSMGILKALYIQFVWSNKDASELYSTKVQTQTLLKNMLNKILEIVKGTSSNFQKQTRLSSWCQTICLVKQYCNNTPRTCLIVCRNCNKENSVTLEVSITVKKHLFVKLILKIYC